MSIRMDREEDLRGKVSFLHSGIPDCSWPIVTHADEQPEFAGIHGTGFFARKERALFFITARHCLSKHADDNISAIANRLHVPYSLSVRNASGSDYVQFESICSYRHHSAEIPGTFMDVVVLQPNVKLGSWQDKHLRSAAAKIPPTGEWLDRIAHAVTSEGGLVSGGTIPMVAVGYPVNGTSTEVIHAPYEIVTQRVVISGLLRKGTYPHTLSIVDVTWEHELNGFSGSPVFARLKDKNGPQYALAGMLVVGGNRKTEFIRISQITEAVSEMTRLLDQ
jgi:hypothetical protein